MCINPAAGAPVVGGGEPLEMVGEFTYLGNLVSTDDAASKDIAAHFGRA